MKNPLQRTIASVLFAVFALCIILALCTSCTIAHSKAHGTYASLGGKAKDVKINATGIDIGSNNNVEAFQAAKDLAQKAALYKALTPVITKGVDTLGDLGSDALKLAD
ncbi:MAG: hypothetical protein JNJ83_10895 [Verrucomicrobiaceae bacterium]|nr:hypothetical protein [Verrucomicrobiaceae bacterium]